MYAGVYPIFPTQTNASSRSPRVRGGLPEGIAYLRQLGVAPCTRGFTRQDLVLRRDVHGRPVYAGVYPDPNLVKTLDQRPHHRRIPGRVQGIRLRRAGHGSLELLPPTAYARRMTLDPRNMFIRLASTVPLDISLSSTASGYF